MHEVYLQGAGVFVLSIQVIGFDKLVQGLVQRGCVLDVQADVQERVERV